MEEEIIMEQKPKFNVKYWLSLYNEIHEIGKTNKHARFKKLQQDVRTYLDKCGYTWQPAIYPYDAEDTTTWKYIPTTSVKDEAWTVLNPDWKYKELAINNGHYNDITA